MPMAVGVFKMVLLNVITSPVKIHFSSSRIGCMRTCLSKEWCLTAFYLDQERQCDLYNTTASSPAFLKVPTYTEKRNYYQIYNADCPLSYTLVRQPVPMCYKVYRDRILNQDEGDHQCEADGGSLITLDSLEKHMYMKGVLEKMTNLAQNITIGLRKVNGIWVWPSGLEAYPFARWVTGRPFGYSCAAIDPSSNFDWVDVDCNTKQYFICEVDIS